ncbi:hypothetical protein K437DRAFT_67628 [Tilletiaria anomala UBC 951]|uniref:Uncharacterized protein n=1 Tax=Tilletiaria anomala (strain ATCC 24038 / CBS 436.72 / UBC 951) TaxID=1037660 RepID=A0A066V2E2_TILAU|nr:uncharacterized protein K437DRAFT_67628 [Tilletiaria anomala UBC 951]KDN35852.1 hypothetical protein K437DRAFT_67628 [Tilletiaria anomala UBC 951]
MTSLSSMPSAPHEYYPASASKRAAVATHFDGASPRNGHGRYASASSAIPSVNSSSSNPRGSSGERDDLDYRSDSASSLTSKATPGKGNAGMFKKHHPKLGPLPLHTPFGHGDGSTGSRDSGLGIDLSASSPSTPIAGWIPPAPHSASSRLTEMCGEKHYQLRQQAKDPSADSQSSENVRHQQRQQQQSGTLTPPLAQSLRHAPPAVHHSRSAPATPSSATETVKLKSVIGAPSYPPSTKQTRNRRTSLARELSKGRRRRFQHDTSSKSRPGSAQGSNNGSESAQQCQLAAAAEDYASGTQDPWASGDEASGEAAWCNNAHRSGSAAGSHHLPSSLNLDTNLGSGSSGGAAPSFGLRLPTPAPKHSSSTQHNTVQATGGRMSCSGTARSQRDPLLDSLTSATASSVSYVHEPEFTAEEKGKARIPPNPISPRSSVLPEEPSAKLPSPTYAQPSQSSYAFSVDSDGSHRLQKLENAVDKPTLALVQAPATECQTTADLYRSQPPHTPKERVIPMSVHPGSPAMRRLPAASSIDEREGKLRPQGGRPMPDPGSHQHGLQLTRMQMSATPYSSGSPGEGIEEFNLLDHPSNAHAEAECPPSSGAGRLNASSNTPKRKGSINAEALAALGTAHRPREQGFDAYPRHLTDDVQPSANARAESIQTSVERSTAGGASAPIFRTVRKGDGKSSEPPAPSTSTEAKKEGQRHHSRTSSIGSLGRLFGVGKKKRSDSHPVSQSPKTLSPAQGLRQLCDLAGDSQPLITEDATWPHASAGAVQAQVPAISREQLPKLDAPAARPAQSLSHLVFPSTKGLATMPSPEQEILAESAQVPPARGLMKRRRQDSSLNLSTRLSSIFYVGSKVQSPTSLVAPYSAESIDRVDHQVRAESGSATVKRSISSRVRALSSELLGKGHTRHASTALDMRPPLREAANAPTVPIKSPPSSSRFARDPSIDEYRSEQGHNVFSTCVWEGRNNMELESTLRRTRSAGAMHARWAAARRSIGGSSRQQTTSTMSPDHPQPPTPPSKVSIRRTLASKIPPVPPAPSTPEIESWRVYPRGVSRLDEIENRPEEGAIPSPQLDTRSKSSHSSPAAVPRSPFAFDDSSETCDKYRSPAAGSSQISLHSPEQPLPVSLTLPDTPLFDRLSARRMLRDAGLASRSSSSETETSKKSSTAPSSPNRCTSFGLGLMPGSPAITSATWDGPLVTITSLTSGMAPFAHSPSAHAAQSPPSSANTAVNPSFEVVHGGKCIATLDRAPEESKGAEQRGSFISSGDDDTPLLGYSKLVVNTADERDEEEETRFFFRSPNASQQARRGQLEGMAASNPLAGRYRSNSPTSIEAHRAESSLSHPSRVSTQQPAGNSSESPSYSTLLQEPHVGSTEDAVNPHAQLPKHSTVRTSVITVNSFRSLNTPLSDGGTWATGNDALSALDAEVSQARRVKVDHVDKGAIKQWASSAAMSQVKLSAFLDPQHQQQQQQQRKTTHAPSTDHFQLPISLAAKLQPFPDVLTVMRQRTRVVSDPARPELVDLGKIAAKRQRRSVSQPIISNSSASGGARLNVHKGPDAGARTSAYLAHCKARSKGSVAPRGNQTRDRRPVSQIAQGMATGSWLEKPLSSLHEGLSTAAQTLEVGDGGGAPLSATVRSVRSHTQGNQSADGRRHGHHPRHEATTQRYRTLEQRPLPFRTADEAVRALQREEQEREWQEQERERRRQEAHAERHAAKKKRDPLLAARLALVGLESPAASSAILGSAPVSAVHSQFAQVLTPTATATPPSSAGVAGLAHGSLTLPASTDRQGFLTPSGVGETAGNAGDGRRYESLIFGGSYYSASAFATPESEPVALPRADDAGAAASRLPESPKAGTGTFRYGPSNMHVHANAGSTAVTEGSIMGFGMALSSSGDVATDKDGAGGFGGPSTRASPLLTNIPGAFFQREQQQSLRLLVARPLPPPMTKTAAAAMPARAALGRSSENGSPSSADTTPSSAAGGGEWPVPPGRALRPQVQLSQDGTVLARARMASRDGTGFDEGGCGDEELDGGGDGAYGAGVRRRDSWTDGVPSAAALMMLQRARGAEQQNASSSTTTSGSSLSPCHARTFPSSSVVTLVRRQTQQGDSGEKHRSMRASLVGDDYHATFPHHDAEAP